MCLFLCFYLFSETKDKLEMLRGWVYYQTISDQPSLLLDCSTQFPIQPWRETGCFMDNRPYWSATSFTAAILDTRYGGVIGIGKGYFSYFSRCGYVMRTCPNRLLGAVLKCTYKCYVWPSWYLHLCVSLPVSSFKAFTIAQNFQIILILSFVLIVQNCRGGAVANVKTSGPTHSSF